MRSAFASPRTTNDNVEFFNYEFIHTKLFFLAHFTLLYFSSFIMNLYILSWVFLAHFTLLYFLVFLKSFVVRR